MWLQARHLDWLLGIRLGWSGFVRESGTAVFVFNLQTRTKRHPCVRTFACSEETETPGLTHISSTNCYRHSLVFGHKKLHVKHIELRCWLKSTAVRLYIRRELGKPFQLPNCSRVLRTFFHEILKWIHLKLLSNVTQPGHNSI